MIHVVSGLLETLISAWLTWTKGTNNLRRSCLRQTEHEEEDRQRYEMKTDVLNLHVTLFKHVGHFCIYSTSLQQLQPQPTSGAGFYPNTLPVSVPDCTQALYYPHNTFYSETLYKVSKLSTSHTSEALFASHVAHPAAPPLWGWWRQSGWVSSSGWRRTKKYIKQHQTFQHELISHRYRVYCCHCTHYSHWERPSDSLSIRPTDSRFSKSSLHPLYHHCVLGWGRATLHIQTSMDE